MLMRLILPPCSFVRTEEKDNLGAVAGMNEKDILGAAPVTREALSPTMLIRWGLLPCYIG